jgi:hypothetical protein
LSHETVKHLAGGLSIRENHLHRRLRVFVYPSGVDVSGSALRFLSARLRVHRRALGIRWRRLSAGRQTLLVLVHLRNSPTYAQLAAGFDIGITTVYRYVTEAVALLAALVPTLAEAVRAASMTAYLIPTVCPEASDARLRIVVDPS